MKITWIDNNIKIVGFLYGFFFKKIYWRTLMPDFDFNKAAAYFHNNFY